MKIETVTLTNFRCFGPDATRIRLDAGITALVGNNGSGKTALLATLRHRPSPAAIAIRIDTS